MKKHHLLPNTLSPEQLANWLQSNARETFEDEKKVYFEQDEINDMARQSSGTGAEMLGLKEILKEVKNAIENGLPGPDPLVISVAPTSGTKALEKSRAELDKQVKMGYEMKKQQIYGIPCHETENMIYFDISGNEISERCRPLSSREKQEYIGIFRKEIQDDPLGRRIAL